ncbi:MAG: ABC transporter ATP-binding protein [Planctomycetaceae bacterium]|jgi:zinc transport system ATP-binding protein|nr:ABC transporter ATP-binding protein [Planctomycetaceae bacterium]
MSNIIEFNDVSFAYDLLPVLESVTFGIATGDFVSVIGPNGGGKTTLLRLMLGLLRPDSGQVLLFGEEPSRNRDAIGYTPQFLQVDLSFPLTVGDVVLMGRLRRYRFWVTRQDRQYAEAALETVRLADLRDKPFRQLSGGQRQRVLIARALCSAPKILLLDEPTNNIDPTAEEMLFDILTELNKRLTVVLVSHDVGVVSQYVRNVVCVNRRVSMHPTASLNGNMISDIYGRHNVNAVLHEPCC